MRRSEQNEEREWGEKAGHGRKRGNQNQKEENKNRDKIGKKKKCHKNIYTSTRTE